MFECEFIFFDDDKGNFFNKQQFAVCYFFCTNKKILKKSLIKTQSKIKGLFSECALVEQKKMMLKKNNTYILSLGIDSLKKNKKITKTRFFSN